MMKYFKIKYVIIMKYESNEKPLISKSTLCEIDSIKVNYYFFQVVSNYQETRIFVLFLPTSVPKRFTAKVVKARF